MHKFLILQGIQGSGKSYYALQWVREDPNHRIRINQDDIRNMFGYYWLEDKEANNQREKVVKALNNGAIKTAMFYQFDVVIDNMNLSKKTTDYLENLVNEFNAQFPDKIGYKIEYKRFDTPLDICIERDSKRERPIGKEVITATYNRYYGK